MRPPLKFRDWSTILDGIGEIAELSQHIGDSLPDGSGNDSFEDLVESTISKSDSPSSLLD